MLKKKLFIVNFKTYKEATGKNALILAKKLNKLKANLVVAVEAADINSIFKSCKNLKVFSQYIDLVEEHRGSLTASLVKSSGAKGTLINHSNNPLKFSEIKKAVKLAKKYKLISVVCSEDEILGKKILKLKPDYIAIEPKELISGKISVSEAKPELIRKTVKILCNKNKCNFLLVGAGIHSSKDVKKAFELGANGILISSALVKSKNPYKLMKELIQASK